MTNTLRPRLLFRAGTAAALCVLVVWTLSSAGLNPSRPAVADSTSSARDTLDSVSVASSLHILDSILAPSSLHAPDSTSASNDLVVPVSGIDTSQLRDTYDAPRSGGRTHKAIDIRAPAGTSVLAVTDGTIARRSHTTGGGRSIYQYGPDSAWVFYYAHLEGYADDLGEGDAVQRGQVIGYVGDTGNAPDGLYHLHFAVWTLTDSADFWHGSPLNPYPLLMEGRRPAR